MVLHLLVIKVLQAALDVHVLVLRICEGSIYSEQQRSPRDSQRINMVVFECYLRLLFLFFVEVLIHDQLIDSHV